LNGVPIEAGAISTTPLPPRIVEPIQKTEPVYTEEARLAELEGVVVLSGEIDEEGFARNLKVAQPIGLGLDQNAMDAVRQWRFQPVLTQPQEARPIVQIAVDFRLTAHQSRWHLIQALFDAPLETERPVFLNAHYPIGAGLGPEAMEEGLLVVAMGRLATAKVAFDIDEHGVPIHLKALSTSDPVWGGEATAVVGQWRFTPGTKLGIAVPVPCTVELVWGEKELTADLERQLHDVLAAR
jgi:TonB family protein